MMLICAINSTAPNIKVKRNSRKYLHLGRGIYTDLGMQQLNSGAHDKAPSSKHTKKSNKAKKEKKAFSFNVWPLLHQTFAPKSRSLEMWSLWTSLQQTPVVGTHFTPYLWSARLLTSVEKAWVGKSSMTFATTSKLWRKYRCHSVCCYGKKQEGEHSISRRKQTASCRLGINGWVKPFQESRYWGNSALLWPTCLQMMLLIRTWGSMPRFPQSDKARCAHSWGTLSAQVSGIFCSAPRGCLVFWSHILAT